MEGDFCQYASGFTLCHFNPLPPHGGRLSRETFFSTCVPFQSTPSAWRETYDIDGNGDWITFQSTPSAWRETLGAFDEIGVYSISIHSLRMEGDTHNGYNLSTYDWFQSTPSAWRETLLGMVMNKLDGSFQSTPSAWRETAYIDLSNGVLTISIHSLRMEGDMSSATYFPAWYIFQSTPSAWRETQLLCNVHYFNIFQSTPSAWRETSHRR